MFSAYESPRTTLNGYHKASLSIISINRTYFRSQFHTPISSLLFSNVSVLQPYFKPFKYLFLYLLISMADCIEIIITMPLVDHLILTCIIGFIWSFDYLHLQIPGGTINLFLIDHYITGAPFSLAHLVHIKTWSHLLLGQNIFTFTRLTRPKSLFAPTYH